MTSLGLILALLILAYAWSWVQHSGRVPEGVATIPPEPLVTGTAVLLCHRAKDRSAGNGLAAGWARERVELVRSHASTIAYRSYAQVHQVSRLNVIYLLLRLSRTWPINAVFSSLHGLPIPALRLPGHQNRLKDWDMIEIFEFAEAEAARRFLDTDDAAGARMALAENADARTARSQAVSMTVTRAFLRRGMTVGAVVTLFCLRARSVAGREGMIDYWLQRHRPYVQTLEPVLGYDWYDQLIARGAEDLADPAKALDQNAGVSWDGVASIGYRHMGDLFRGIWDLRLQAANLKLVYDETRFIDLARSSLMLGEVSAVEVRTEPEVLMAASAEPVGSVA